jgi:hypothetical protein
MNTQAQKLEIVRMVLNTESEKLLSKIKNIFDKESVLEEKISLEQYNQELEDSEKQID